MISLNIAHGEFSDWCFILPCSEAGFSFFLLLFRISLMDLLTPLALVSEYKNLEGPVVLLGIVCWEIFLELQEREINPFLSFSEVFIDSCFLPEEGATFI